MPAGFRLGKRETAQRRKGSLTLAGNAATTPWAHPQGLESWDHSMFSAQLLESKLRQQHHDICGVMPLSALQ
eukprot:12889478-Prorocentrum_lima.AAC.1